MKPLHFIALIAAMSLTAATCKNSTTNPVGGRICKGDSCLTLEKFSQNLQAELDGRVVKYAFVLRHGLASTSHAAGKRRTASDPPEQDFTIDHRYNPASVTKVITAVALLQLIEKNNLSIQDKIWTYLPKHWIIPNSIKEISFRQLLRHTAGIRFDPGNTLADIRTSIEHGVNLSDTATGCDGSAEICYKNINYAICRVLIAYLDVYRPSTIPFNNGIEELIISKRFIDYMQKNIFDKLNISSVTCTPPANGGTLFYPFPAGSFHGTDFGDWALSGGPAGIQLSTNELSTFLLQLRISTILLSKNMLQIMDDNSFGWDVPPAGSPWNVDGDECNSKGGWFPGDATHAQLNSCIMDFKNGLQITLVSNGMADIFGAISNAYKKSWTK